MRAYRVEVPAPLLNDDSSPFERVENLTVQQFVT